MEWKSFWEGSKDISTLALVIRAIILYIALIAATRMMGHRQVGILSGHNYLVAAGIVSLAAVRMVSPESSLTAGLVIVFVYAGVNVLLSYLDIKWPKGIDRQATVLMQGGRLLKANLLDCHVTLDNLLGQLRLKGAHNLSEIDTIVLEPYGKISVVKKPEALPVTRKQMNLPPKPVALPTILIYDGVIDEVNLHQLGLDHVWLLKKLGEKGITNPKDVFLAMLEAQGTVYISV
ncbi:YetF domain-containing protein [Sporomusa sp.]|uniref:YetF domain-containing protein n=1 Tax=Sporomusa sp. TaxID=2078658 RepID=UPI002CFC4C35|nr:YetF domain-containing protein [Sporomusa sp.]HWR43480.1 YetF domain-containing protein [Sporomusa sp.]